VEAAAALQQQQHLLAVLAAARELEDVRLRGEALASWVFLLVCQQLGAEGGDRRALALAFRS
jgi:hypothetical protein